MVMMVPTVEVLQDLIGLCHAYAATKTECMVVLNPHSMVDY